MKNILYILLMMAIISSCRKGDQGVEGDPGASYYKSANGNMNAIIHYKYPNGDTAIVPATYNSILSNNDNIMYMDTASTNMYPYYSFDIIRYDAEDASNFIRISSCEADYDKTKDSAFTLPYNILFGISKISAGANFFAFATMSELYHLHHYYEGENITISNYYLNPTTHRLTFDYEIVLYPDEVLSHFITDGEVYPVIKGSVDVILLNTPYYLEVCDYYIGG